MIALRHILCPVDFSETSIRALSYAAAFAAWYDARLEVLHVAPAFDAALVPAMADRFDDGRPYPATRDDVVATLHRAIEAAGAAGLTPRALVQEGRAHDAIANRATAEPADLIVMGTHGRSGFNRLLLGSITEKVLRAAPCPVLTVPPAAPGMTGGILTIARILCPVDDSASARRALQYAIDLAGQAGAHVTVLHALEFVDPDEPPEPSPFDPCRDEIAEGRRRRQQRLDHARSWLHAQLAAQPASARDITEMVAVDRAYKAILRQAEEERADLIVMGAQGAGGLELMLYGSNTQHVVRAAACPVLTVRATGAASTPAQP